MGGSSKKQKIGNRYYYGFVLVPLRQMDSILELVMSEKTIWQGNLGAGRISVTDKADVFGGDEREGGFLGDIDVQSGAIDQPINDYYEGASESLVSALRGCVSLVFRQPYIGANTARLPSIKTKHVNIKGIHRGWNIETAVINPVTKVSGAYFFIVMDMGNLPSISAFGMQKNALITFVEAMRGNTNSIRIVCNQAGGSSAIEILDCNDSDYDEILNFIETRERTAINLSVNQINLSTADAFFNQTEISGLAFIGTILTSIGKAGPDTVSNINKHIIILSAQVPTSGHISDAKEVIAGLKPVSVTCISLENISGEYASATALGDLDNTSSGTVYQAHSSIEVAAVLKNLFLTWADMNPAHIIRCLWTDPMRGGTVDETEIGDSFEIEAARYLAEGLGLSPKFRGIDQANSDRTDIERHVDAMSYRSNRTGKIELVSVRDNYDVGDLIVLDSSIVKDWSGLSRPRKSEIPNQLTVTYTRRDGEQGSVTRTNTAGVRRQGRVIKASTVNYPSCTTEALAIQLCLRDLRSICTDALSGTLPLQYLPPDIEPGSVVLLNEPRLNIKNVIARVSETRIGQHDDSTAWITVFEDNFSSTQFIDIPETVDVDRRAPLSVLHRLVTEASYFQGVFSIGQAIIDDELSEEPDLGRIIATGAKANNYQLEARLATSIGEGWTDHGVVDFEPYGVLLSELTANPTENEFLVEFNETLTEISAGDLARIDGEIIRIDDLDDLGDGTVKVTCGRGCLDGPPSFHLSGRAFVISSAVSALNQDFIAGQSIDVKMLSRTGSASQSLSEVETDTVILNSRAIRPYPVGQFQIGNSYESPVSGSSSLDATWVHRDRTLQTTPAVDDHLAPSIGPEAGVFYTPFIRYMGVKSDVFSEGNVFGDPDVFIDETSIKYELSLDGVLSPPDALSYTFDITEPDVFSEGDVFGYSDVFKGAFNLTIGQVRIGVRTTRGEYDNLQEPYVSFSPLAPPTLLISQ